MCNQAGIVGMPSETQMLLSNALLRKGQVELAQIWGVSSSETSRKLKSETGIKLEQFADALDAVGARIVFDDEYVVVPLDEFQAIETLARKALNDTKR